MIGGAGRAAVEEDNYVVDLAKHASLEYPPEVWLHVPTEDAHTLWVPYIRRLLDTMLAGDQHPPPLGETEQGHAGLILSDHPSLAGDEEPTR